MLEPKVVESEYLLLPLTQNFNEAAKSEAVAEAMAAGVESSTV